MPRLYAILAGISIAGVLFFCSYKVGYLNGKNETQMDEMRVANRNMEEILTRVQKFDELTSELERYRLELKDKIDQKHTVVEKEVIKYAQVPANVSNNFDDDWVRIYNQSLPE